MESYYICISGHKVLLPDNILFNRIELDMREWEHILCCPITQDFFTDPVITVPYGTTYERMALIEWVARKDKDPLTGQKYPQIEFETNELLKAFLYRIENRDNKLIFYDIACVPKMIQLQAKFQHPFQVKGRSKLLKALNNGIENYYLSFVDWRVPLFDLANFIDREDIDLSYNWVTFNKINDSVRSSLKKRGNYSLRYGIPPDDKRKTDIHLANLPESDEYILVETVNITKAYPGGFEIMFCCPFTGEPIVDPVLNGGGLTTDRKQISGLSIHYKTKVPNLIIKQILDIFGRSPTVRDNPTEEFATVYSDRIKVHKYINMSAGVKLIIGSRSDNAPAVFEKMIRLRKKINPNAVKILSKIATRDLLSDKGFQITNRMRHQLRLSGVKSGGGYDVDLSFLNFSNTKLKNINVGFIVFDFCNFSDTIFVRCKFICCSFIGAIFSDCEFRDCEFEQCIDYGHIGESFA